MPQSGKKFHILSVCCGYGQAKLNRWFRLRMKGAEEGTISRKEMGSLCEQLLH